MPLITAFQTAGGVQLHETTDNPNIVNCRMVYPGDEEWEAALIATTLPSRERTYYSAGTGLIERVVTGIGEDAFATAPDLPFLEGRFSRGHFYVRDGAPAIIPPQPENTTVFDGIAGIWIDGRTEEQWRSELSSIRLAQSLSRIDFILACASHGLLSEEEAEVAATGEIPAVFAPVLEASFEMRVRWRGATIIERNDPFVTLLATAREVDEWTLDQVFGIAWPRPLPSWEEGRVHP